ncbi:MAG: glycosyltransferase, partial [Fimbriiglobus sp.]
MPKYVPADVAQVCQGDEVYGVGSVQKLYAVGCPDMMFVCVVDGPMYRWLKARGSRVVLADGGPGPFRMRWTPAGLADLWRLDRVARRAADRLSLILRNEGVRVAQSHWLPQQLLTGHLRRHGFKSVWQINNNMSRKKFGGLGAKVNHGLARRGADLLLPASDFIRANWDGCGVPLRRLRNAAPALGTGDFRPAPPGYPVRAVIAGRLDRSKGIHLAVDAVLAARAGGHDITLDVFGGPVEGNPYLDTLRDRVAAARATGAVRFLGFATDLRERHADYHFGFQCRIDPEPCSVWVCETLVDGLPLIASATGGTPELVADGETGLLFDP